MTITIADNILDSAPSGCTLFTMWSCYESRTETVYNTPASCDVYRVTTDNMSEMLDSLYLGQGNNLKGEKIDYDMTSMSVGDVIEVHHQTEINENEYWACAGVGFIKITGTIFAAWKSCSSHDRNWLIRDIVRIKQGEV